MKIVAGGASSIESITLSSVMLDDGRTMVRRKETKLRNGRVLIRDTPIFVVPKRVDHSVLSQGVPLEERPETIPNEALLPLVHRHNHDRSSSFETRGAREKEELTIVTVEQRQRRKRKRRRVQARVATTESNVWRRGHVPC